MNSNPREITLVNQIIKEQLGSFCDLQPNDNECFILNPIDLYSSIDWTKFEEDLDVLNSIYAILFDEFVIARKKIVCYWPSQDYADDKLSEINEYCLSAGVGLNLELSQCYVDSGNKMFPEHERLWCSFMLFLVESICEDIKLNEELEEIATLKCDNESILVFSIRENGITRYSYLKSQVSIFELEGDIECFKQGLEGGMSSFLNFQELMGFLMNEINIKKYSANFSNSSLEKQYYRAISLNFNSFNLVQQWMANFNQN
ncbi:hypothetical protein [Algoriphagus yeomjeoni]|uniref:Uncharacterized protein n=1 Tax=Algoriphagus yeomjeoni TaxID=291403 RepID=A0A327PEN6_9BACT|nr:hypothetical protein [Algoriphagus yeomjeoni]RAI90153.1 hypothetical protein LV83_02162 [Algoriphagus yeomjeoni]